MWYGDYASNKNFLINAVQVFPQDGQLWYYLAILCERNDDNADAKTAISNAYNYGFVNQSVLSQITNNQPVSVPSHPVLPKGLPQF
jgi:Flp pilus assembly protein TadD